MYATTSNFSLFLQYGGERIQAAPGSGGHVGAEGGRWHCSHQPALPVFHAIRVGRSSGQVPKQVEEETGWEPRESGSKWPLQWFGERRKPGCAIDGKSDQRKTYMYSTLYYIVFSSENKFSVRCHKCCWIEPQCVLKAMFKQYFSLGGKGKERRWKEESGKGQKEGGRWLS